MSRSETRHIAANDARHNPADLPDDIALDELEQAIWQDPALTDALKNVAEPSTRVRPGLWQPAMAACFVLLVSGGLFFLQPSGTTPVISQLLSYQSKVAERQMVNLQDGSEILLNADTQLSVSFSAKQRSISLKKGEAYFDVQKDPQRPFIIGTQWGDIQVVGTEFNVDQTAQGVEVSVYEGQVQVTSLHGNTTMLQVGEMARLTADKIEVSVFQPESQGADWMSGQLIVQGHSIQYVVDQLNRYSEQPIYLAPDVRDVRISGAFEVEKIEQSLNLLTEISGLQLSQIQGVYYLSPIQ
ncbi:FecR family protein [Thalassolituus hydrocarboniclasticus]|uniref:FecR domain-containing protein n=1 Tax=Thalassolituus hydrocarboniclasticus TaxID=2742796 RepID=A0ABY6ACZ1_9GAMM|nr:FecR domain-containing protein [Thalassolituus hydrocarboniclasticus]UXD88617.1 FecR domain-containing protein [Thalassolituus hydrocarboniclasticus]